MYVQCVSMTCMNNLAHQGSCACYLGSKPTRLLRVWVCSVLRTCCFVEHHAGAATSLSACVLGQLLSCCRLAEGHADWTLLHRVPAPCNVSSVLAGPSHGMLLHTSLVWTYYVVLTTSTQGKTNIQTVTPL